jgi:hypothetical protein
LLKIRQVSHERAEKYLPPRTSFSRIDLKWLQRTIQEGINRRPMHVIGKVERVEIDDLATQRSLVLMLNERFHTQPLPRFWEEGNG